MNFLGIKVFFILFFFNKINQVLLFQCKGENNQDVDWFILYKLPKLPYSQFSPNLLMEQGNAYMYMTENNRWTLSERNISTEDSMLGYTLAPIYNNQNEKNSLWFLYNDNPPNESKNQGWGAGKGVVMVNETRGFWLVHSASNFPPVPSYGQNSNRPQIKNAMVPEGRYAFSSLESAHTILCISLLNNEFDTIGKQLVLTEISVYKKNLPRELISDSRLSDLVDAANEKKIHKSAEQYMKSIKHFFSANGKEFISVAKNARWISSGVRFYDFYRFLARELKDDLDVKTWPDKKYSSVCDDNYKIYSVFTIDFKNICQFNYNQDSSKWAITSSRLATVCIGDVDTGKNTTEYGGGAICIVDQNVWADFKKIDYSQFDCNF